MKRGANGDIIGDVRSDRYGRKPGVKRRLSWIRHREELPVARNKRR